MQEVLPAHVDMNAHTQPSLQRWLSSQPSHLNSTDLTGLLFTLMSSKNKRAEGKL